MARIMIITRNFPPMVGGMENLVADIYQNLSRSHQVRVVTPGDPSVETDPNIIRVPSSNVMLFLIKALWAALRQQLQGRADLLISGSLLVSPVTVACGALTGTPRIGLCHGLDLIYPAALYQMMLRLTVGSYHKIVANSSNTLELAAKWGVARPKLTVIHPGVSDKFLQGMETVQPKEDSAGQYPFAERPSILSVGRLTERKGILPFIRRCFPLILREVPDCVLVIVGDDPKQALAHRSGEMAAIVSAVDEFGLAGSVVFQGQVSDRELKSLYRAVDLLVFPVIDVPGDVEGFGMVAIEAAAAETPSVASKIGGIVDAVEEGVSGNLVEPADYGSFAEKVITLLKDDRLRNTMGQTAKKRVEESFTWGVLTRQWEGLIAEVLETS